MKEIANKSLGMGKEQKEMFDEIPTSYDEDDDELSESSSIFGDDSDSDNAESSSSDCTEDARTNQSRSTIDSNGPLYELSSLLAQPPVKRGLSNYYQGKSQSFTSLSDARCLEDLPKKEIPYKRNIKTCKSYAGGLDEGQRTNHAPCLNSKSISKKPSRGSCGNLMARSNSKSLLCRPPAIPVNKSFCNH
ncbi:uncharacterized protein [Typha latifolia]|uniref:uncharacterized protein n=1 Tax=Typha latifolia TaxID=4733 RepID=UPI003C2B2D60